MPYRVRPLRWELLTNPIVAGLEMETRAGENLGRYIAGAGADIAAGITRGRTERESKRRYAEDQALRQRSMAVDEGALDLRREELSLRNEEMLERERERQANEADRVASLASSVDQIVAESQMIGQPKPETAKAVVDLTGSLGGANAAQEKLAAQGGGIPEATPNEMPGAPSLQTRQQQYRDIAAQSRSTNASPAQLTQAQSPGVSSAATPTAPQVPQVPDRDSIALSEERRSLEEISRQLSAEMTAARRILHSKSLHNAKSRADAELAFKRAETEAIAVNGRIGALSRRIALATKAETAADVAAVKGAEDAAKIERNLGQFDALVNGGLGEHELRRLGPQQIVQMRLAVEKGGDPDQILARGVSASPDDKAMDRVDAFEAERNEMLRRGQPLTPKLMNQDEKDAAWEERFRKRVALNAEAGMDAKNAAAEAKADDAIERKIDKFLYAFDNKTGRRVVQQIPWQAFSPQDMERIRSLRDRGDLDAEAEAQFQAAEAAGRAPGGMGGSISDVRESIFGPQRDLFAGWTPEAKSEFGQLPPEEQRKVISRLRGE